MSYSNSFSSPFSSNSYRNNRPKEGGIQQDLERMAKLACLGFLGTGAQARRMKKFLLVQWTILIIIIFLWWKHNGGLLPHYSPFLKTVTPDIELTEYFKIEDDDASLISWEQGIRSKEEFQKSLESDVMMFEVNVSLRGYGTAKQEMLPIVLHSVDASEELLFRDWLVMVINTKKGFKINFVCIEAVDISLQYLVEFNHQLTVPIHLSAAVLNGPNAEFSRSKPLDASRFIHLCRTRMPQSTLSLGWTSAEVNGKDSYYSWSSVKQMFDIIHDAELSQPVSLNVKSEFVSNSVQQLKWLMQMTHSSICIYLNSKNLIPALDILTVRKHFSKKRLYYIGFSDILSEVRSLEAEQTEEFPDDTLLLKADLWQVHPVDSLEMLMASESFLIKHGLIESIDDLYPNEVRSRVIQVTVEFINAETEGRGLSIYLHGLLEKSGMHGIRCSIHRDGQMLLSVEGVSPLHAQPNRAVLSGSAPCFMVSIVESFNKQVKFTVQRPQDCSFKVIEHERQLMVPIVGMELKSGRIFLSKANDTQHVVIDRFQIS